MMLSAQHDKQTVYTILQNTYGADPNLRDYSGRKAEHYLNIHEEFDEDEDIGDEVDYSNVRRSLASSQRRRRRKANGTNGTTFLLKELLRDPAPLRRHLAKSNP